MSSQAKNLTRAAALIRRIADTGNPTEFDGVPLHEIAADCALVSHELRLGALREEILTADKFVDNVVSIDRHSRRVGA